MDLVQCDRCKTVVAAESPELSKDVSVNDRDGTGEDRWDLCVSCVEALQYWIESYPEREFQK